MTKVKERLVNDTFGFMLTVLLAYLVFNVFLEINKEVLEKLIFYQLIPQRIFYEAIFAVFLGVFSLFGSIITVQWLEYYRKIKLPVYTAVGLWLIILGSLWGNFFNKTGSGRVIGQVYWAIYYLTSGNYLKLQNSVFALFVIVGSILVFPSLNKLFMGKIREEVKEN